MSVRGKPEPLRRGPGRPAGARAGASRDALLKATRALLAEKGLQGLTLRDVAKRAGVQPALVHYYFGGKDGLLREVIAEVAQEMLQRVQHVATLEGSAEDRLRALVRGMAEALAADPYAPRLIAEQVFFPDDEVTDVFVERFALPNLAVIQGLLEEGRAEGSLKPANPMFFVPSFLGSILFFFLSAPVVRRLFDLRALTPELTAAFADSAAELLLHGLAVPGFETEPRTPAHERSTP